MMKNNWFTAYCNMSKDEKDLYNEFEMKDTDRINLKIYERMYDAVTLMSLDCQQQMSALPKGVHIPDEIALVFHDEVVAVTDMLYKNGMLSLDACSLIKVIENKLFEIGRNQEESLWTLEALEKSKLWEECRSNARLLLSLLYKIEKYE